MGWGDYDYSHTDTIKDEQTNGWKRNPQHKDATHDRKNTILGNPSIDEDHANPCNLAAEIVPSQAESA